MPIRLEILFEDVDFVAVNKPSGLLSIPDRYNHELENLHDLLAEKYGHIQPVHRLDRETSGIIVFAKTQEANRQLSKQFEEHRIRKTYLALAQGEFEEKVGVIDAPISDDKRNPGKVWIDLKHGKPARTEYVVVEEIPPYSLVELRPQTGRQHQIRIHLSHIRHPLAIDPAYGGGREIRLSNIKKGFKSKREEGEQPLMDRLTLHAWKLRFHHFRTDQEVEVVAELPRDFQVLLKQLRKWSQGTLPVGARRGGVPETLATGSRRRGDRS